MSGKKYFYAMGQRARALNMPKMLAQKVFTQNAPDYARIAFDAGFRGLPLN